MNIPVKGNQKVRVLFVIATMAVLSVIYLVWGGYRSPNRLSFYFDSKALDSRSVNELAAFKAHELPTFTEILERGLSKDLLSVDVIEFNQPELLVQMDSLVPIDSESLAKQILKNFNFMLTHINERRQSQNHALELDRLARQAWLKQFTQESLLRITQTQSSPWYPNALPSQQQLETSIALLLYSQQPTLENQAEMLDLISHTIFLTDITLIRDHLASSNAIQPEPLLALFPDHVVYKTSYEKPRALKPLVKEVLFVNGLFVLLVLITRLSSWLLPQKRDSESSSSIGMKNGLMLLRRHLLFVGTAVILGFYFGPQLTFSKKKFQNRFVLAMESPQTPDSMASTAVKHPNQTQVLAIQDALQEDLKQKLIGSYSRLDVKMSKVTDLLVVNLFTRDAIDYQAMSHQIKYVINKTLANLEQAPRVDLDLIDPTGKKRAAIIWQQVNLLTSIRQEIPEQPDFDVLDNPMHRGAEALYILIDRYLRVLQARSLFDSSWFELRRNVSESLYQKFRTLHPILGVVPVEKYGNVVATGGLYPTMNRASHVFRGTPVPPWIFAIVYGIVAFNLVALFDSSKSWLGNFRRLVPSNGSQPSGHQGWRNRLDSVSRNRLAKRFLKSSKTARRFLIHICHSMLNSVRSGLGILK